MTASESAPGPDVGSVDHERLEGLESYVTTAGGVGERFDVEAPFDGAIVGHLPACDGDDIELAFEQADQGQTAWAERSVAERAEVIVEYHDLVLDHAEELLDVVQLESGKARRHAYEEVLDVTITARHYAYRAEDYLKSEQRDAAIPGLTETTVHHHPKGTIGIISPWNYPLSLAVSDALPAILAGNSVVLKPAEQTSYTALKAVELLREAGVPRDVFQVVTGFGPDLGEPLVANSDYVCFTGSSKTGRIVASQAGEHLTGVSLELGGKNPGVVCEDADIDRAVAEAADLPVVVPTGIYREPWVPGWAREATFLPSVYPPTKTTFGWAMSTAPEAISSRCRYRWPSFWPAAIGIEVSSPSFRNSWASFPLTGSSNHVMLRSSIR
jgi:succinate-semialdehyde dehydrogenase/glutarate-semialdehyde dehydrogenase